MTENKLVIGRAGTGKTRKEIVPAINDWKGSVLALDVKKQLYDYTIYNRKKLGFVVNDLNLSNANVLSIVTGTINKPSCIYLTMDANEAGVKAFTKNFDLLLGYLAENDIGQPLLITLDEFLVLDKLTNLVQLIKTGRKRNVTILMSMEANNEADLRKRLKKRGYDEEEVSGIISNCILVNL